LLPRWLVHGSEGRPAIRSRRLWVVLLVCAITVFWGDGSRAQAPARYPGATWSELGVSESGWSGTALEAAKTYSQQIGSAAVVVVQHGAIVATWGDTNSDLLLNSARKSLLSALIGRAVERGQINLNATMGQLGIDDNPPSLTAAEKQATVRQLLEARSGIYHGANYETPSMAALRPVRGSHAPGTYWYYNNWDFNALGAIYEHAVATSIFTAFDRQIALPIGMQDFDSAKCRYVGGPNSIYPAYLFFASARDLARFGLLYLHLGHWKNQQVIPASWVRESTRPYSIARSGAGYGYLWWTAPKGEAFAIAGAPPGSYWAEGNGGQVVFVVPSYDLVIVHLARTQYVMGSQRGVGLSNVFRLISDIIEARPNG
jgi:CubicO group peptidase (beta-lactamase class C family)